MKGLRITTSPLETDEYIIYGSRRMGLGDYWGYNSSDIIIEGRNKVPCCYYGEGALQ